MNKEVEHLGLDVDGFTATPKLSPGRIKDAVAEQKAHPQAPR
jgi:hypothetical protein